jgi:hypothetical protein
MPKKRTLPKPTPLAKQTQHLVYIYTKIKVRPEFNRVFIKDFAKGNLKIPNLSWYMQSEEGICVGSKENAQQLQRHNRIRKVKLSDTFYLLEGY